MRAAFALALVFGLAGAAAASPFRISVPFVRGGEAAERTAMAPLLSSMDSQVIDDHYIVVLRKDAAQAALNAHQLWVQQAPAKAGFRGFKHAFDVAGKLAGYTAHVDAETLEQIRRSPEVRSGCTPPAGPADPFPQVAYVEKDQILHTFDIERNVPSWGIARIAYRKHPTPRQYKLYNYDPHAGSGVTAYIIDTGVNIHHQDFEGRAVWGKTIPEGDEDADGNGHGSHVAGTVAGRTFGVAKKANIKAVKVLRSNGSGTLSDVIRGIEWAVTDHEERVKAAAVADAEAAEKAKQNGEPVPPKTKVGPALLPLNRPSLTPYFAFAQVKSTANMSLGGGRSKVLDRAVDAAVEAGIHFAVAAGNDARDACQYSPAASELAVTVGASSIDDSMAWFSNHGKCVDIFGPGKDITSAWIGSNVATNTISGTSMASPHICGLLTLFLSLPQHEDKTPKELKDVIVQMSTKDVITGLPIWSKTANRLAFTDPPARNATA
ncbi:serine protease [Hyaloraphidium curvatum]|nr:serine protease [Hyaloraphidium curvatum]